MDVVDKDFFRQLDSKLSYKKADESIGYHSNHIGDHDFQTVLKAINSNPNLILYPITGPKGLYPSFVLGIINDETGGNKLEEILHFSNQQLPAHYSFENLSRGIFSKPHNLAKAKNCGISYSTHLEDYRPKSSLPKQKQSFFRNIFRM